MSDLQEPPVDLILGCQRSGTTLLRLMLGAHRELRVLDEASAYAYLQGQVEQPPADATRLLLKIPRLTELLLEPRIVDDFVGSIDQFYAGNRGLFLVRDPRDVAASMALLRQGEATWLELYGRAILEHRASHLPAFAERHGEKLATLRDSGYPGHLTAALYWRMKNDCLSAYRAAELPILPVVYADLVSRPGAVAEQIAAHLEIPYDERMLAHDRAEHDQLQDGGLAIGGTDPRRAIDRSSEGRYRSVFSEREIAEIDAWTRDAYLSVAST